MSYKVYGSEKKLHIQWIKCINSYIQPPNLLYSNLSGNLDALELRRGDGNTIH